MVLFSPVLEKPRKMMKKLARPLKEVAAWGGDTPLFEASILHHDGQVTHFRKVLLAQLQSAFLLVKAQTPQHHISHPGATLLPMSLGGALLQWSLSQPDFGWRFRPILLLQLLEWICRRRLSLAPQLSQA